MSTLAKLVVMGQVTEVEVREGTNARGPWRMVSAYLAGRRTSYEVSIPVELESRIAEGEEVALVVDTSIYRDRVSFRALELWDGALPDESVPGRAA